MNRFDMLFDSILSQTHCKALVTIANKQLQFQHPLWQDVQVAVRQEALPGQVQRNELSVHTLWQVQYRSNKIQTINHTSYNNTYSIPRGCHLSQRVSHGCKNLTSWLADPGWPIRSPNFRESARVTWPAWICVSMCQILALVTAALFSTRWWYLFDTLLDTVVGG